MHYGLIGKSLVHSLSPEIHAALIPGISYACRELPSEAAVHAFLKSRAFSGVNVTVPYKRTVLEDLDWLSPTAQAIGAVNCIVQRKRKLYGYNTDFTGLDTMLKRHAVVLQGRTVAILGTGGAARCAAYVVRRAGGRFVFVSRNPGPKMISYDELYRKEAAFSVLIQATPVGMFPEGEKSAVDLKRLPSIRTVVDLVANPLRTGLQFAAKMLGRTYIGGFEMLVRQAAKADAYFFNTTIDEAHIQRCMTEIRQAHQNIVLIGMPSSGKTSVAATLGKSLHRPVLSMDEQLAKQFGKPIRQVFAEEGEAAFRRAEEALAISLRNKSGYVIATGGGMILSAAGMQALGGNGIFVWLDRDFRYLKADAERPLSANQVDLRALYTARHSRYEKYSDVRIENNGTIEEAVALIREKVLHVG